VQQRSVAALLIALLSLAGMLGLNDIGRGVYLAAYALLAGVVAFWLAITAMTRARRERTARPRASLTATVIASVGIALSAILLVAFAVLGKELATYSNCLAGASTISSKQACQSQFSRAVSREISAIQAGAG
jgi:amino acid transporter